MVRKGAFCVFLSLLLFVGLKGSLSAQTSPVTFKPDLIPKELEKVKPYRDVRWNLGTITLNSGDLITGYLCYEPKLQLLLSYKDGRVSTHTINKINKFSFIDPDLKLLRQYQSIPSHPEVGKKRYQIYEIITLGDFSLLRQETNSNAAYDAPIEELASRLCFDYFVWTGNEVWPYRQFQKEFLAPLAFKQTAFRKWTREKERPSLSIGERRRMVVALNKLEMRTVGQERTLAKN